jgi:hypothetical protein
MLTVIVMMMMMMMMLLMRAKESREKKKSVCCAFMHSFSLSLSFLLSFHKYITKQNFENVQKTNSRYLIRVKNNNT